MTRASKTAIAGCERIPRVWAFHDLNGKVSPSRSTRTGIGIGGTLPSAAGTGTVTMTPCVSACATVIAGSVQTMNRSSLTIATTWRTMERSIDGSELPRNNITYRRTTWKSHGTHHRRSRALSDPAVTPSLRFHSSLTTWKGITRLANGTTTNRRSPIDRSGKPRSSEPQDRERRTARSARRRSSRTRAAVDDEHEPTCGDDRLDLGRMGVSRSAHMYEGDQLADHPVEGKRRDDRLRADQDLEDPTDARDRARPLQHRCILRHRPEG